jgi:Fic family protein
MEIIQDIHRAVVGADSPIAGEIRNERVSIRGSLHVPPNYMRVPRLLEEMIARYYEDAADRSAHPVNVASRLHFDLLTIHPFKDGNGRTARLLQNLELIREGYAPILIDPQEKAKYFDIVNSAQIAVAGVGDPEPFLAYMVTLEHRALTRYLNVLRVENDPYA